MRNWVCCDFVESRENRRVLFSFGGYFGIGWWEIEGLDTC